MAAVFAFMTRRERISFNEKKDKVFPSATNTV
jgi:hypothetical protein